MTPTSDATPGPPSILGSLPSDLSLQLFASATTHRLREGERLFLAGDTGDGCYRLDRGLLKILVSSREGDELIVAFLGEKAMVGELAVIDGLPRSATAVAAKDCELSFISRAAFDQATRTHPELYRCVLDALAARLRETTDALAAASFLSSHGRVARALFELAELVGEDTGDGRITIAQRIGQRDLAAMAGIARENVSRILGEWKRSGLVTRPDTYYRIESLSGLKAEMER